MGRRRPVLEPMWVYEDGRWVRVPLSAQVQIEVLRLSADVLRALAPPHPRTPRRTRTHER